MSEATTVSGPLNGIRILDLTHVWAGPLATRLLSDLGAEVVKVERDLGRGPSVATIEPIAGWIGGEPGAEPWNNNAAFVKLARNAKSLSLDLKHAQGRALFLRLVAVADVVIENFSARAMPSMDLGYSVLQAHNPALIYVTMPGYGASGPYKDWVAFGPTVEPMTGLTQVLGYSAAEPRNSAIALMDPIAGTTAATGLLEALRKRQETGLGGCVELSLHECGVSFNGPWLIDQQLGATAEPVGNEHPEMAPHGLYACLSRGKEDDADWIAIACQSDAAWRGLVQLIGTELDADWDIVQRRTATRRIDAAISAWTQALDKDAAAAQLQQAGVAAGPVASAPDMLSEAQAQARGFFASYERHNTPIPGNPIQMQGLSQEQWTPCPPLGAHSQSVLMDWLGLAKHETAALLADGIIAERPSV
ncbi:MAG TPA: hypothetical protein DER02_11365 [Gammaproteobacteria bacterium]|nr:hypothetical protein [Gammaproteobacteria bacterium]|tara:strand:- start:60 stop:1316 length:1257 start_codon:yes stop_codon:yes gene_type:complete